MPRSAGWSTTTPTAGPNRRSRKPAPTAIATGRAGPSVRSSARSRATRSNLRGNIMRTLLFGAMALAVAMPAGGHAAEPDLAAVRAATERFQDVKVALAEGYIADPSN